MKVHYYLRLQLTMQAIYICESMATAYQTSLCYNPNDHDMKVSRTYPYFQRFQINVLTFAEIEHRLATSRMHSYVETCHSPLVELSLKRRFCNADKGLKSRQSQSAIHLSWVGGTISMATERWQQNNGEVCNLSPYVCRSLAWCDVSNSC